MQNKDEKPAEEQGGICFGNGNPTGAFGIIGGVLIALGVPFVTLAYGQPLGNAAQITITIIGVSCGALVSLTSAFFGLVMPSKIAGRMMNPDHWARWAEMAHAHKRAKWEARFEHRFGRPPRSPWMEEEAEAEKPARPPRRKRP